MPQLGPLNWILLFSLFWVCLFVVMSINWWFSLTHFSGLDDLEISKSSKMNNWLW
uniref:ATP synthase complex subunit 8 n=1 Tax=Theodoxus fluviatilis TaxID=120472 RepID=A0A1B2G3F4_9GAST|nr:ATP synthase F0 subunit 8 [Theodoxus fluviatilis]